VDVAPAIGFVAVGSESIPARLVRWLVVVGHFSFARRWRNQRVVITASTIFATRAHQQYWGTLRLVGG
jgi:hypothetical protein